MSVLLPMWILLLIIVSVMLKRITSFFCKMKENVWQSKVRIKMRNSVYVKLLPIFTQDLCIIILSYVLFIKISWFISKMEKKLQKKKHISTLYLLESHWWLVDGINISFILPSCHCHPTNVLHHHCKFLKF